MLENNNPASQHLSTVFIPQTHTHACTGGTDTHIHTHSHSHTQTKKDTKTISFVSVSRTFSSPFLFVAPACPTVPVNGKMCPNVRLVLYNMTWYGVLETQPLQNKKREGDDNVMIVKLCTAEHSSINSCLSPGPHYLLSLFLSHRTG